MKRLYRWLAEYVADTGFRRDLHCYGGLALLASGVAMVYGPGHALVAVGVLLFALPLVVAALGRRSG